MRCRHGHPECGSSAHGPWRSARFEVSRCEPKLAAFNLTRPANPGAALYFCVGDSWRLEIDGARPQAPIDLFGRSDGLDWVLSAFARTDAGGGFKLSGIFGLDAIGTTREHVVVDRRKSNEILLRVASCQPQ